MVASGLNPLNHNLSQSLSPGTEQPHFLSNEHIHPVHRLRQRVQMTTGNTKAKIKLKRINVSYWPDWAKATASLHPCDEAPQKHTHTCIPCSVLSSFLWASTVSACQTQPWRRGAWLWPPSGRIMSSEPDSEATRRNAVVRCTVQHNVGAKQTVVLPFLFECLIL